MLFPETFIYIWGINVISEKYFGIVKNMILSAILSILFFYIRFLPVYLGVHMVVNIIITISIMAIAGIPIIKSIYATLLLHFVLSLGRFINLILINLLNILNIDTILEFSNPFTKCLLGVPSLIILLLFVIAFYYVSKQRK